MLGVVGNSFFNEKTDRSNMQSSWTRNLKIVAHLAALKQNTRSGGDGQCGSWCTTTYVEMNGVKAGGYDAVVGDGCFEASLSRAGKRHISGGRHVSHVEGSLS